MTTHAQGKADWAINAPVNISAVVPRYIKNELEQMASARDMPLSRFIRRVLRRYVKQQRAGMDKLPKSLRGRTQLDPNEEE